MLLISRLSYKVSFPRLHSTLLPQASGRRTWTAAGWTTSRGFHPPAGSLSAALLACGWDGAGVSLSLAGFMAKQPATGCFSDGCDRSAPSLAVIDKSGRIHCNLAAFTGGPGASSCVAFPLGTCQERIQVFGYEIVKEHWRRPLFCLLLFYWELFSSLRTSNFKFFKIFCLRLLMAF